MTSLRPYIFHLALVAFALPVFSQDYNNIEFIENKGQWENPVKFKGEVKRTEFFFGNNSHEILELIKRIHNHGTKKCNAVLESTGNMWMRIHDTLEDNGIDTILANPYKTKIIAQAKIKSDKLDVILIYKNEIPFTPLLN